MNKHNYIQYCIALLSILAVACERMTETDGPVNGMVGKHILTAVLETETETKTTLSAPDDNGVYYPYWSKGDALAVYADGINIADTYSLSAGDGTGRASFRGDLYGQHLVALYPAADKTSEGLQGNVLTLELPAQQEYANGSFGNGSFPMLAVSDNGELSFKNLCSVLKVSLTGEESVKSIKFISADSWQLVSGKATVRTDYASVPELVMADDGSPELTLECGSVELNPTTPTDFFLVVPSGTYHGGFTIEIKTYHGTVTRSTTKDITFGRSQFRAIPSFECVGSGEMDMDVVPYNQIWYVTQIEDRGSFKRFYDDEFDVPIVSDSFENGKGILTFSGPVTAVNYYAFASSAFTEVHLPDCVNSIGQGVFYGSSISSFRTPDQLNSVGSSAFGGCKQLARFYGKLASEDGRCIFLEDGYGAYKRSVKNYLAAFAPAGVSVYTIPSQVEMIGDNVFASCPELRDIRFNEGLKCILGDCFVGDQLDCDIVLPSTLESLDPYAFRACSGIRGFYGNEMFHTADNLCLKSGNWIIKFVGTDVTDYSIPENIIGIENYAFENMQNLHSITFPASIKRVPSYAFYKCPNLQMLYGECVSSDHKGIVVGTQYQSLIARKGITKYIVQEGIESIGYCAFSECSELEEVIIPDTVKELGGYDFNYCQNLKRVVLSSSLERINYYNPFLGSQNLEEIYFRSLIPPAYSDTQFYESDCAHLTVYVPKESLDLYRNSSWSQYAPYMVGYEYEDLEDPDYYISSDYSRDGEVVTLQTASEGEGIELVLMGDGFSDRQIADGTYDAAMQKMMDAFFGEEPYATYKNLFNVHAITVVSATEGYDHGGQTLGSWFGYGTQVGGNDSKCMDYALKVVPEAKMNNTLIVVAMNRDYYAGTCYMYYPSSGDYGVGTSVAYFPTSSNEATYLGLVRHEAGGHGFAKLADEYAYDSPIPDEEKSALEANMVYGWSKNVDFTSDPEKVKWAKFLKDERYQYDGLGVFEGGATYATGVWRPTENSMMRYNDSPFNAPSREAIWYRIHKLAYGDNWEYNYEDFVAYDAKNRKTAAATKTASPNNYVERRMEPTHPPVVVHQTWKEAMQKAKVLKPAPQQNAAPAPRNPVNSPVKTSDFR